MSQQMFRFKRFEVAQSGVAGMKVGTDAVLLGAWCAVEPRHARFLDIGTGTGVIALMLAQRSEPLWTAHIDAIDIDEECCRQASDNAASSPWSDRISIIHSPVQKYAARRLCGSVSAVSQPPLAGMAAWRRPPLYDHIVSNPPYFTELLLPPSLRRATARHTLSLEHDDLTHCVASLLSADGIFSLILPYDRRGEFFASAAGAGLLPRRAMTIYPRAAGPAKRILMEFGFTAVPAVEESAMSILDAQGTQFTAEYIALTRDFYLKF